MARRSHVLLLGDSRMRIMAFALYKMLGGEGLWSREQLDCCKALVCCACALCMYALTACALRVLWTREPEPRGVEPRGDGPAP